QRILDLGTGTGALAIPFARQGACVTGVDVSSGQLAEARALADNEGLDVEFIETPAENLPWRNATFDVATANQCWLYFDRERVLTELRRVLKPHGLVMTSHFSWLARRDPIACRTEQLVLKFNPQWTAADWSGIVPPCPEWAAGRLQLRAMFYYDEPIPFTRESWRGRIRACRGIGAELSPHEVAAFDEAHARLLEETVPEHFTVLHRIDAHLFSWPE
ncbi:MAG: class I SAM-dependent methyltransferase, partial [Planctomycetales bacterium]|nr:class I SAM-dependent methyltransferase [Planctomycetales bacterium]